MKPIHLRIQQLHIILQEHSESEENFNIQQPETDIINGCKQNNRKAQEQLYRNYYGVMMQLCLLYTKNESDAREVLNNGFLKVFQNIQRYDPAKASLYTWIRTVVVRSCIDFIKQKAKRDLHEELSGAEEINIEAEAILSLEAAQLLHFIRQLSPATQAVFNLNVMEGYTHKEIAQLLTISEGTSKWHLSEARRQLQQMITSKEVKI